MAENSRIAAGNETGISGQHNNLYGPDDNVSMASKCNKGKMYDFADLISVTFKQALSITSGSAAFKTGCRICNSISKLIATRSLLKLTSS